MISPLSSAGRTGRPDVTPLSGREKPRPHTEDRLSTDSGAFLKAELERQPEIRPEVVARARALAADPSYPPPATIRAIAQQILAAPDPTEAED